ncbi:MAG: hypothetical protein KGL39_08800 [Patescibacteria group bacterium]|nr:hypothetical protein [Patescibacteria group bacterium]
MAEFLHPSYKEVKVRLSLLFQESVFLGCHTNSISHLSLSQMIINDPKKEVRDEERIGTVLIGRQSEIFSDWVRNTEECHHQLFAELRQNLKHVSIVFMSGPCNTGHSLDSKPGPSAYSGVLSIAHFAQWLKDQGEFIMGSPILTNVNHLFFNFSVLRGWMWIPDHMNPGVKHIADTEYVSGKMKNGLPFDEWGRHHKANRYVQGVGELNSFALSDLYGG